MPGFSIRNYPPKRFPLVQPLYHESYLLAQSNQKYMMEHWRRVSYAKSSIDNKPPRTFINLRIKLKKLLDEGQRLAITEMQNKFLLQMIIKVMRGTGTVDHYHKYLPSRNTASLRYTGRKFFAKYTNEENKRMLKRILFTRTNYDHIKQELDYQRLIKSRRGRAYVFKYWNELFAQRRDAIMKGKSMFRWVDEIDMDEMRAKMAAHHRRCFPQAYPTIVPQGVPPSCRSPTNAQPVDHERCFTPFPILPPIPPRLKSAGGGQYVKVSETKAQKLRQEEISRQIEAMKPPPIFRNTRSPSPKPRKGKGEGGESDVNQSAVARNTGSILDFLASSPYNQPVLQDLMIPPAPDNQALFKRDKGGREKSTAGQDMAKRADHKYRVSQKDTVGRNGRASQKDTADQIDTVGPKDTANHNNTVGQKVMASRKDLLGEKDTTGQNDTKDRAGRKDPVGQKETIDRKDRVDPTDPVGQKNSAGKKVVAKQKDRIGKKDTARQKYTAGKKVIANQNDTVSRKNTASQKDTAGKKVMENQKDTIGQKDTASQKDTAGKKLMANRKDAAGQAHEKRRLSKDTIKDIPKAPSTTFDNNNVRLKKLREAYEKPTQQITYSSVARPKQERKKKKNAINAEEKGKMNSTIGDEEKEKKISILSAEQKEKNNSNIVNAEEEKKMTNVVNAEKGKERSAASSEEKPRGDIEKGPHSTVGYNRETSKKRKTICSDVLKKQKPQLEKKNSRRKLQLLVPPKWLYRYDWRNIEKRKSDLLHPLDASDSMLATKKSQKSNTTTTSTREKQSASEKEYTPETTGSSSDKTKRTEETEVKLVEEKAPNANELGRFEESACVLTSETDKQRGLGENLPHENFQTAVDRMSFTEREFLGQVWSKNASPRHASSKRGCPRLFSSQGNSPRLASSQQYSPRIVSLQQVFERLAPLQQFYPRQLSSEQNSPRATSSQEEFLRILSSRACLSEGNTPWTNSSRAMFSPDTRKFFSGQSGLPRTASAPEDICRMMEPSRVDSRILLSSKSNPDRILSSQDGTSTPRVAASAKGDSPGTALPHQEQGVWSPEVEASRKEEFRRSASLDRGSILLNLSQSGDEIMALSPKEENPPGFPHSSPLESARANPMPGLKTSVNSTESGSERKHNSKSTSDTQDTVINVGGKAATASTQSTDDPDDIEEEGNTTDDAEELPSSDTETDDLIYFRPISQQELSSSSEDENSGGRYWEP